MAVSRAAPYVYTFFGLVGGLWVLFLRPFSATANYIVGGGLLVIAAAAVAYMIVAGSGPGRRGPEF